MASVLGGGGAEELTTTLLGGGGASTEYEGVIGLQGAHLISKVDVEVEEIPLHTLLTTHPRVRQQYQFDPDFQPEWEKVSEDAQFEVWRFTYQRPKQQKKAGEVVVTTVLTPKFGTHRTDGYQKWYQEAINGKVYPEHELIMYKGKAYLPEHFRDRVKEEMRGKGEAPAIIVEKGIDAPRLAQIK